MMKKVLFCKFSSAFHYFETFAVQKTQHIALLTKAGLEPGTFLSLANHVTHRALNYNNNEAFSKNTVLNRWRMLKQPRLKSSGLSISVLQDRPDRGALNMFINMFKKNLK